MSSSAAPSKELTVALGVLRRTIKELAMYRQEVREGQDRLAKLSPDDDAYSQAAKVLEESRTMVANTADRLDAAIANVKRFDADEAKTLIGEAMGMLNVGA